MDEGAWPATVHMFAKVVTTEGLHFHFQGLQFSSVQSLSRVRLFAAP